MIAAFDLAQVGRSPARFDFAKLESLNGHYLRQAGDAELVAEIERLLPHIAAGNDLRAKMNPALRFKLVAAMPALKERAKTLVELIDSAHYIYADRPIMLDDKAAALLNAEARAMIAELVPELERVEPWTAASVEAAVRAYADTSGRKLGAVAQPLRAALTGRTTSPGIFDVLAVLGKSESVARLRDQTAS
jgi:glutamyl-tRNA synthetase